jgi:phosphate transport system protein
MPSHYEETLQRDIERIRGKVNQMAGLVEQALRDGLKALQENNRQLAYLVILRDQSVDELEREVDRLCLEFLVRQQPAAGHLRFAYVTIKINQELERIGDYAESIARQMLKLAPLKLDFVMPRLAEIANLAIPMVHDAVAAFLDQNVELARKTLEAEASVNALRDQLIQEINRWLSDKRIPLEALHPLSTIVRRYERVSDQSKNICEEVIYMVTGEYAKHKTSEIFRVLFVDEDNACLSRMAEGVGMALKQDKFLFSSAGLNPQPISEVTARFFAEKNLPIVRQTPVSLAHVPNLEYYQVVVIFTPQARAALSRLPAKVVVFEWLLDNPAKAAGSEAEVRAAYEAAYQYVDVHVRDLMQAILGHEISSGTEAKPV